MKTTSKRKIATEREAETPRQWTEREFLAFAATKGWDADRRLQVLAELSYPDAWTEMLDELAEAGWTDGLIGHLHEYHDAEEDYFTRLLQKLLHVKPLAPVSGDLIDAAINRLNEIKAESAAK